jgi:hypothetical protein
MHYVLYLVDAAEQRSSCLSQAVEWMREPLVFVFRELSLVCIVNSPNDVEKVLGRPGLADVSATKGHPPRKTRSWWVSSIAEKQPTVAIPNLAGP